MRIISHCPGRRWPAFPVRSGGSPDVRRLGRAGLPVLEQQPRPHRRTGREMDQERRGRGYKIIHMYRTDCGEASKVEMTISAKNGKSLCTLRRQDPAHRPGLDSDYLMHAETKRWKEMGAGEYGPMRAMMFGRLKFEGPKGEAMRVMGPFEQFLLIPGKVPGEDACPK
jgi:putative sterol carrier protein